MNYKDKILLITGASYGIGYNVVTYFANLGCHIIMTYNKHKNLSNNVSNEIKKVYHVDVDNIKCDISNENDIEHLYNFVKEKYGKIDILVNNAALSLDNYYKDKTKNEFMKVLEVNVVGTFLMIKYFSDITNYIFNISSSDAIDTGSEYNIDYSCSKASINCMTTYFSLFAKNNKVISICPNWVDTLSVRKMNQEFLKDELKRIKQEKLINPKSIAIMIKKCIDDNISSGSIIRIDGDIDE